MSWAMVGFMTFPIIVIIVLMALIIRQERITRESFKEILAYALIERLTECELRGNITMEEMENISRMYVVYNSIGGKGLVDILYKRVFSKCLQRRNES